MYLKKNKLKDLYKIGLLFILIFLLKSCASEMMPTGGIKDTIPPTVKDVFPKSFSKNIKPNKVNVWLNEDINPKDVQTDLIITPRVKDYKVNVGRRKITISIKDTLKENTTYSFNFRNSIMDINEENQIKNYKIVYSTGDIIDSFFIKGRISNVFTEEPIANACIALYDTEIDSLIEKNGPIYMGRSEKTGLFEINNIKENKFYVLAFDDVNKDSKFQKETEKVFKTRIVEGDSVFKNYKIYYDNTSKNQVTSTKQRKKSIVIKNTKFPIGVVCRNIKDTNQIYKTIIDFKSKDLNIYPPIPVDTTVGDTMKIEYSFTDSSLVKTKDTLEVYYKYKNDTIVLNTSIELDVENQRKGIRRVKIKTETPIREIKTENIMIYRDNDSINISKSDYYLNSDSNQIIITIKKLIKDTLKVKIPSTSLIGIHNDTNATINFRYDFQANEEKGSITGKIEWNKEMIVQLLSDNFEFVASIITDSDFMFTDLKGGNYILRILDDVNKNLKWDRNDYKTGTEAEKFYLYSEIIELKQGWDVENVLVNLSTIVDKLSILEKKEKDKKDSKKSK